MAVFTNILNINIKITIYTYCYDYVVCYMQTNVCVMYIWQMANCSPHISAPNTTEETRKDSSWSSIQLQITLQRKSHRIVWGVPKKIIFHTFKYFFFIILCVYHLSEYLLLLCCSSDIHQKCNSNNVMLPSPVSTLSFIKQLYCIAKQNLKPTSFCKKLAEVIVILNRASSIDKHTQKSQITCLSLLLRESCP